MNPNKAIIIPILAAAAIPAAAQYNQSINVEGKYIPEIFRIDRINSFPKAVKFSLDTRPLAYDSKSVAAAFAPRLMPLPATGWRDSRSYSDSRGYLDLGAGSWLTSTLSAGYRFVSDETAVAGIRLQHNSTSLWKPELSAATADTRMERYDETLGFYGSRLFEGKGRLSAAVDWHIGNFNYYGFNPLWFAAGEGESIKAPTQTLNDISARISWESPSKADDIFWTATAGARYFGYRSLYLPATTDADLNPILERVSGGRETDINLGGNINFPLSGSSAAGIDMNADVILYAGSDRKDAEWAPAVPDNYGIITLTPYYRLTRERLNVRIGADIDLSFNAGDRYDRYGTMHVAPDIRADYQAGPAALYLHLLGGSRLNTLASGWQHDYYQTPWIYSSRPVYTPLDGSLGVSFGPFGGFSAGADFAFRISKGEYLGGWYQTRLNCGTEASSGLPDESEGHDLIYDYSPAATADLHGFSLGVHASYDTGRILSVSGEARYQPQNGEKGYFNGFDRPRWTARLSAETNPWSTLRLRIAYEYRGVRTIYASAYSFSGINMAETTLVGQRLPDLCMLNLGASYAVSDNFNFWIQADNLLNRHDELMPGLPRQGITASAGIGLTF